MSYKDIRPPVVLESGKDYKESIIVHSCLRRRWFFSK